MTLWALQDLFRRHRERATGLWKLGTEGTRTLFLEAGDIVFGASNRPQDRLTSILVERGKLTQVQLDYVMANLKPGLSIGRNLIDMGYITQRDLLEVARLQVERVVYGALAQIDDQPVFEGKELDANTVRLPFDTPQLLLNGVLEIQDREGLLDLLGPLNQVVLLEGRRHLELTLPPDLSKLPPLLDGTHTLLEISREAPAEPLRVGCFALFLREMGWARLHELPPLDRNALDMALEPESEPLVFALPEPSEPEAPSLFATIQAAERPTTNLEHLKAAFDSLEPLPDPPQVPEIQEAPPLPTVPEAFNPEATFAPTLAPIQAETGQAILLTPSVPLPELPEAWREPSVKLQPEFPLEEEPPARASVPVPSRKSWPMIAGALLLVGLGMGAWFWFARGKERSKPPEPLPPQSTPAAISPTTTPAPKPSESVQTPAVEPAPAVSAPPAETPPARPGESAKPKEIVKPKETAKPKAPESSLTAIRRGDMEAALKLGEAVAAKPGEAWAIRLVIAALVETVQSAPGFFKDKEPDLFILPFRMRDGRRTYQVLLGPLPNRAAAERALKDLPAEFRAGKNRPVLFKLGDIPRKQ